MLLNSVYLRCGILIASFYTGYALGLLINALCSFSCIVSVFWSPVHSFLLSLRIFIAFSPSIIAFTLSTPPSHARTSSALPRTRIRVLTIRSFPRRLTRQCKHITSSSRLDRFLSKNLIIFDANDVSTNLLFLNLFSFLILQHYILLAYIKFTPFSLRGWRFSLLAPSSLQRIIESWATPS